MTANALAVDDREHWWWPAAPGWLAPARAMVSSRADGDLAVGTPGPALAARRAALVDLPWSWLRQVHGAGVVVAPTGAGEPVHGLEADALVTARPGHVLAVHTADCAPVALASPEGVIAVAHAGWRGLEAGVIARTVEAMSALGATRIEAWLGPCIHAECYEFGLGELDRLAARFGPTVRGQTAQGQPALDVPAGVQAALREAGAALVGQSPTCTGCDRRYFSHRVRAEAERQALVVWRDAP